VDAVIVPGREVDGGMCAGPKSFAECIVDEEISDREVGALDLRDAPVMDGPARHDLAVAGPHQSRLRIDWSSIWPEPSLEEVGEAAVVRGLEFGFLEVASIPSCEPAI
jgi:hypothetical protein